MLCGHINCISHHGEINCIPGTLRTAAKSIAFNTRAKTSALLVHFVRRRRSQWHSTLRRNQVHSWKESLQTVLSQRLNAFDRYSAAITLRCLGTRVRYGACSSSTEPAYGAGTRRSFVRRCVWADSMEIKQPLQWCKRYDDQVLSPLFPLVFPLFPLVFPLLPLVFPLLPLVFPLLTLVLPLFTLVLPLFRLISPLIRLVSPLIFSV